LDAINPDGFKDYLVQQQVIFDRQSRFVAEQPVHFAPLNSKLFSLGEYVLSPVQSAIEVLSQVFSAFGLRDSQAVQSHW